MQWRNEAHTNRSCCLVPDLPCQDLHLCSTTTKVSDTAAAAAEVSVLAAMITEVQAELEQALL